MEFDEIVLPDDERKKPADQFDEVIPPPETGGLVARTTGYYPTPASSPAHRMEGGYEDRKGGRVQTLDAYLRGEAPYVTVAGDPRIPYGTPLASPDFPGIPFRVNDTGSAFKGAGTSHFDIARDTAAGANSDVNNRPARFTVDHNAFDEVVLPPAANETALAKVNREMIGALKPDQPMVPAEYMPPYLLARGAEAVLPESSATKVYTGELKGVADMLSSFTSPANIALLGVGGMGKVAQKLVAGAFSTQAAAHAPEAWKEFNATDDPEQKTRIAIGTVAGIGLPLLGLKGEHGGAVKEAVNDTLAEQARASGFDEIEAPKTETAVIGESFDEVIPPAETAPSDPAAEAAAWRKANLYGGTEPAVPAEVIGGEPAADASQVTSPESVPGPEIRPEPLETPPKQPEVFGFGPGAASAQEPLRSSQPTAQQLADLVSGVERNNPARFARSVASISERVNSTKDALTRAGATVTNLAQGFKRAVWDAPIVTNFDRWRGKWDATLQENDFHIRRLGKELERAVPDVKRQEAIYNYGAAEGDETVLRDWADRAPKDVKQGYLDALTLTEEEQRLANLQRSAYDEWMQRAVEEGMLTTGVENYMKRIVKRRPEIESDLLAKLHTGKFSTNFGESKRRFWTNMVDAERAGIRYDKRIRGQSLYAQSFEHAAINRKAVRQFFDAHTESGRPFAIVQGMGIPIEAADERAPSLMVSPFGARNVPGADALAKDLRARNPSWSEAKASAIAREKILTEYEPINHPAFRNWQWVHSLEDGTNVFVRGDALVHRSVAPKLRNAFERQRVDWLEPILRAQGFVKGSKLSLSLFHNVHEAVNAAGHLTNPANLRPLGDYLQMPEIKTAMEAGLKLVGSPHEQGYFSEGVGSHGWPELVPFLGDYVKAFKDASFEDWIPRLKAEAYLRAFKRNQSGGVTRLRASKNLSPEQNAMLTARQVNATFGELNYRQMMRDPRLQQGLQAMFLAPDFGEAKIRHIGQALTRYGSEQRMAIGLVAAGLYLGSRVLNQTFSGNPRWNKPFSVVVGDREYSLRSLPGDLAHLFLDPRSYLAHRTSPVVQQAVEMIFKRDINGNVVDWADHLKDALLQPVPIPLTHRQGLSWKDQLATALGITPMQYRYENEVHKLIDKWKLNSNDPKLIHAMERAAKEHSLPSDYKAMRDALRDGNFDVARQEYAKVGDLHGGGLRGRLAVAQAMQQWQTAPLTGSSATEGKFKRSLDPNQKALYDKAREERKRIYRQFSAMRFGH